MSFHIDIKYFCDPCRWRNVEAWSILKHFTWSTMNASFIFALSVMMVVWIVGYWMDNKRIYVKV